MELTDYEIKALKGEYGEGMALAAKIVTNLGEFFDAPKTVKVSSVHVSGVSFKTGGLALEKVLETLTKGGRVKVPTFLNPAGFDLKRYDEMSISHEFQRRQLSIIDKFLNLGISPTMTCTPYLNGLYPKKGDILAWAESSAVSFANSVIGARTNRESGLSALATAILGRTPYYGLLIKENRVPDLLVEVGEDVLNYQDPGEKLFMIGLLIGKRYPSSIPYIRGIKPHDVDLYKGFGASMAASGNISLYHVENETPEANWARNYVDGNIESCKSSDFEHLHIDDSSIVELLADSRPDRMPSLMAVGCPHSSIREIIKIDRLMQRPVKNTKFWIFTSEQTRILAQRQGLVDSLESKGVKVFSDTCIVVSELDNIKLDLVVTNSGKAFHYLPKMGNIDTAFFPLKEMIQTAMEGEL